MRSQWPLSLEHTVFLASALSRGDPLRIGGCAVCGAVIVTERFLVREARCHLCTLAARSH